MHFLISVLYISIYIFLTILYQMMQQTTKVAKLWETELERRQVLGFPMMANNEWN